MEAHDRGIREGLSKYLGTMRRRFYWLIRDLTCSLGFSSAHSCSCLPSACFFWSTPSGRGLLQKLPPHALYQLCRFQKTCRCFRERPLIDVLKPILEKAEVPGEVGFVRHMVKEEQLIIPVTIPGRETTVSISIASRKALSSRKSILNITNIVRTIMVGRQGRKAPVAPANRHAGLRC